MIFRLSLFLCDAMDQLSSTSTQVHQTLNVGDKVKFSTPLTDDEAEERFVVIEYRGTRLLVEAVCDMRLKPTFVYQVEDLVRA